MNRIETRAGRIPGMLLWLWLAPTFLLAVPPDSWVPVRWDGGPLEVYHRASDNALSDPTVREAIANWYSPVTLSLLDGSPINCLLLTLSAGASPEIEKQQQQLVKEYAQRARERGLAVLGLVYPGADPSAVASAAADAQLDGLVLEGEFPGGPKFAEQLERALRSVESDAVVIPVATSELLRRTSWPVSALEGVLPGVGKISDVATASATRGLWIDSNMWLVRSLRRPSSGPPVWITQRTRTDSPGIYLNSIADAVAAGGRWVVALGDDLRSRLLHQDAEALAVWRRINATLTFFEDHAEWQNLIPFGTVGIVLDPTGPNLPHAEECLNLVARSQIPYRVIERSRVGAEALAGLRAVLAFDLAPPTEGERKSLHAFAEAGGLVLSGPSWGSPPKDQTYTVLAVGRGEVAVYKDAAPDPTSFARDLNDLVPTRELGVSVFNAPSVLSYVSVSETGDRMLIQLVNYGGQPADSLTIWVTKTFSTGRLYVPESSPVELRVRRSGSRTEVVLPELPVYGALLLE